MASIYVAGGNSNYQLGLGNNAQQNTHTQLTSDWLKVRFSYDASTHALGIKADGTLWAWGANAYNQLGLPSASYTTPTQVGIGTTWTDLAVGTYHTLALKSDGTLWATGLNNYGQCGTGNTSDLSVFTQVGSGTTWSSITASGRTSLAIKTDGTLWGWGENDSIGLLGIGNTDVYKHTPTQDVTASTLWSKVSLSGRHAIALRSNGTLWSWGYGTYGKTGHGDTATRTSPTQVGSDTTWSEIETGLDTSYALKTAGTLWACGRGALYALGTGNTSDLNVFTQIGSATDWAALAAGNQNLIALKTSGVPWVVGFNDSGTLGTGNTSTVTTLTALSTAYTPTSVHIHATSSALDVATVSTVVSAPITLTVANPTGTLSAPVTLAVTATGSSSASVAMNVVNALATQTWTVLLTLSGVDYSARLSGEVTVDAEEGASRTALFTLLPVTGVVNPFTWLGAAVAISLVRIINLVHIPTRVFTGKVDVARFDPSTGAVTFSCSDDLKNTVANLSVEAIDALTINELGLDYSVGAQGEAPLDRWDYSQARMASVRGELDAGAYGNLRVTPFAGSSVWGTFTESGVLYDAAYAIDLPERSDIINHVAVEYEYRRHRCRQRVAYISWANTVIGTDALACGYQSPSTSAVKSALDGCGWELLGWSTSPGWAYVVTPTPPPGKTGSGWYFQGTADACGAMVATVGQRHAQEFTESYQTTITCDQSITTFGIRQKSIRGALSPDWSPNNWETDWAIATPDASLADVDYSGTCTRTQSDEAFKTLCMLAKKEIHGSHRTCRVTFSIPALPELDLVHSATLSTTAIETSGKVARLVHRFNLDSGAAETDVTLAIMGVAAWGAGSDDSLDNPPPPPTWGSGAEDDATWIEDTWQSSIPSLGLHVGSTATAAWSESMAGYLVNAPETLTIVQLDPFTYAVIDSVSVANSYYAAGKEFPQTGFRVALPGVADNYRNAPPIKTVSDARTTVVSVTNPLTLTIG